MTRRIEAGIGDIKVELGERYIDIIKVSDGESHVMIRYNLNDDGKTCTRTITPYFENYNVDEPFRISMTSIDGGKATYTEDEMLGIIRTLNIPRHLKSYLAMLAATDIEAYEEAYGQETREYDADDDIDEFLQDVKDFYESF